MTVEWCRLWHDMPTDPKWRVVARRSGQRIGDVIAVYNFMMVTASQADERGVMGNFEDEDVAAALDLASEDVAAIRQAMQGKVLDGDRLTGWDRRQPKREDPSTERVRNFRKRNSDGSKRNETQCNAPDTDADTEAAPPTPQGGAAGAVSHDFVLKECLRVTGFNADAVPSLKDVGPIVEWIEAGYPLEHVLSTIQAAAANAKGGVRYWSYFNGPLSDRLVREKPPQASPAKPKIYLVEQSGSRWFVEVGSPEYQAWLNVRGAIGAVRDRSGKRCVEVPSRFPEPARASG